MNKLAAIAIVGIMIVSCSTRPHSVITDGVPNLSEVSPGVWRGGQPTAAGWAHLKSIGVKNVIKLNPESEASDNEARALGMDVLYRPVSFAQQVGLSEIPADYFSEAVSVVQPGTYIHCYHGQDRTGLFVAIYRLRRDGWTKYFAQSEMDRMGFHSELLGLNQFWRKIK